MLNDLFFKMILEFYCRKTGTTCGIRQVKSKIEIGTSKLKPGTLTCELQTENCTPTPGIFPEIKALL